IHTFLLTHWHEGVMSTAGGHHSGAGHILRFMDEMSTPLNKPPIQVLKLPRKTDTPSEAPSSSNVHFLTPPNKIQTPNKDATLRIIPAPGHSSDHACFYLEEEDILISGDAISSTPYTPTSTNTPTHTIIEDLNAYLKSLKTLEQLVPRLVMPGHGDLILDGMQYISSALGSQTTFSSQIHSMITISPTPISTKEITSQFISFHSLPTHQHLPVTALVKMHILRLESQSKIVRRNVAKSDTQTAGGMDPTKIIGPGGLTMDKIFGHVQNSRRSDWEGLEEGERKEAISRLKRERESLLEMHRGVDLGGEVCWVGK
ncbi:Beta-lactamase-like protein 2, partial [Rhizophlyctis rosea]